MNMLSLISQTEDIYFNLATEEYLLKEMQHDCFMLWQSQASIVVGKHQNTLAEINQAYVQESKIPVARRITGGGTVYHGKGNLNFTFIRKGQPGKLVDFKYFVSPIVDYLATLGLEAEIGEKNELLLNGLKISGNAEHVFRDRVLHHGTLLFNANLNTLNKSIEVVQGKYLDKAVQSNRATVTNISEHLGEDMSMEDFQQGLFSFLINSFPDSIYYQLTPQDIENISRLRDEKYISEEWIYGYSPDFELSGSFDFDGEECSVNCQVKRGSIAEFNIEMQDEALKFILISAIKDKVFQYASLENVLMSEEEIPAEFRKKLLAVFFSVGFNC